MSLLACCTRVAIRALRALRAVCTARGETEAAAGPSPSAHRCECDVVPCVTVAAAAFRSSLRVRVSIRVVAECLNASTGASNRGVRRSTLPEAGRHNGRRGARWQRSCSGISRLAAKSKLFKRC